VAESPDGFVSRDSISLSILLCSPTRQSTNCPFLSLWRTRVGGGRAIEIDDRRGCDRCSVIGASSQALRLESLLPASSESQLTESVPDDVYVDISEVCDDVASTEKTEEEEDEAEEEIDD
jgi:hypothetical protein